MAILIDRWACVRLKDLHLVASLVSSRCLVRSRDGCVLLGYLKLMANSSVERWAGVRLKDVHLAASLVSSRCLVRSNVWASVRLKDVHLVARLAS